jgi:hypothetical protein
MRVDCTIAASFDEYVHTVRTVGERTVINKFEIKIGCGK